MAKSKHAGSGRSGGKKARGGNPQTRRGRNCNVPVSDSDDALTRSEGIGFNDTLPGSEGEGQHPPESSSAPSFLFCPLLLYPLPQMS